MQLGRTAKILLVVTVVVLIAGVWGLKHFEDIVHPVVGGELIPELPTDYEDAQNFDETGTATSLDGRYPDLAQLSRAGLPIMINFEGEG